MQPDLDKLIVDLASAPVKAQIAAVAIVTKGALNVTRDAQRFSAGLAHAPHYPASITYDVKVALGHVEAEIGPDKNKKQGALGNILEYGTPSNNDPIAHLGPALDIEGPKFERAFGDAVGKVL